MNGIKKRPLSLLDESQSFAALLRRFRRRAGLTQEALAELSGMSTRAISDLERGERQKPYRDTVRRIAEALKLRAEEWAQFDAAVDRRPDVLYSWTDSAQWPGLPGPITPLIGRETETERVCRLLKQHSVRLVTLHGPGGVGKTRLALNVAEALRHEFDDGAYFISLGALRDAKLVASAVAQALKVREAGARSLEEFLQGTLHLKSMLLVFDNFEHVLEAVPLVTNLLMACHRIKVLVTSRVALQVSYEYTYDVPTLAMPEDDRLPAPKDLLGYESVRLFVERARAAQVDFEPSDDTLAAVAEICCRLDGLPLAIELAAARVRMFPPRVLLERLDRRLSILVGGGRDLPPRQQTLRATMEWSESLLSSDEQALFRRCAVFAGGFSVKEAVAVCRLDGDRDSDVETNLEALVANSVLEEKRTRDGQVRLRMLETIREFAGEQLARSEDASVVRLQHAACYLALAEEVESLATGLQKEVWLERLDLEHDNLRAALRWSVKSDPDVGLRLAAAMRSFWEARGYLSEGRQWLAAVLSQTGDAAIVSRAKALYGAGVLASAQGDYEPAEKLLGESLAVSRATENEHVIAMALTALGNVACRRGDYGRARTLLEESLALCRTLGDAQGSATALSVFGEIARYQSDYGRAKQLLDESLTLHRAWGDQRGIAAVLNALGEVARYTSDYERAQARFEECLALYRALGDRRGIAVAFAALGFTAQTQGEYVTARSRYEESLSLRRELGDKPGIARLLSSLGEVARHQKEYGLASALNEEALELQREVGDERGITMSLNCLGWLAYSLRDYDRAKELYSETLLRWRALGDKWGTAAALLNLGRVARHCGDYQPAASLLRDGLGLFRELNDLHSAMYALENLAGLTTAAGFARNGALLFGSAEAQREVINARIPSYDRPEYDDDVALARARLDDKTFADAWHEGRRLTLDQALVSVMAGAFVEDELSSSLKAT